MGAQWEMSKMMTEFVELKYDKKTSFDIEMTTKRNPKAGYNDPDGQNKYTMYIIKDGKTIAKSKEQSGNNKSYWSGAEYAWFYSTLEDV